MSDWWNRPTPAAPRQGQGFPRPLYPPDVPPSSGHEPSARGPEAIAYKRAISRLGRWPWQTFDDGYWTDFAHGETCASRWPIALKTEPLTAPLVVC